jgi:crotonobetainyl-CoA:carnitine CoA-transferase CaiB-like acyl-CoA transferase
MQTRAFDPLASGPLNGVRVLDLCRLVSGNMVTHQLADFGADVIKVEPAGKGDPLRHWTHQGISTFWKAYARNKRSVAVNFRAEGAVDAILRMATSADVFVENFRPGVLEKMGLSPEKLHAANPKMVIMRISGFGQTGPYRDRPGFGSLVEGMSGFAFRNGFPDRPPLLPPLALADMIAGLQGAYATMVALREVELKGGMGQVVDLSLLQPILSALGPAAMDHQVSGTVAQRVGNRSNTSAPRDVYTTKDGKYVALSASIQQMTERVFRTIGREDMITDPRFATNEERVKRLDEVNDIVAAWIADRDFDDVMAIFQEAEITAAPIYNPADIKNDPHVLERGVLVSVPDDEIGEAQMHNIHPYFSETPGTFRSPAPKLGEHTDAVLAESGFDEGEIQQLRSNGVIG